MDVIQNSFSVQASELPLNTLYTMLEPDRSAVDGNGGWRVDKHGDLTDKNRNVA